ncbi:MbtH domain protein [Streptomyces sp. CB01881]|uniref:MbtH domain protein n=1 Tax=Streptomyces sp. CB01881 TaxID=2078691 RepID=UPI000CDC3FBD|nr:MbtH domain protein [Streptomyces sp. CB01881]AUY52515.1 MbtH domain protein [Streptomyces sp. CB01881]TYC70232.1 MbtH domain protein [Streptomyces sp. CB01881]
MDDLTRRLADGPHPLTVGGPQPSLEDLRRRVEEIGYVFVKFTGTQGGTDLGVRLDRDASQVGSADFGAGTGSIHVEGTLYLNDDPVRCIADIDLATMNGTGHVVLVTEAELVG